MEAFVKGETNEEPMLQRAVQGSIALFNDFELPTAAQEVAQTALVFAKGCGRDDDWLASLPTGVSENLHQPEQRFWQPPQYPT